MAAIEDPIPVGVVGVGSMGRQHARVYAELRATRLVGVADADVERAREVAEEYGTTAMTVERLLSTVEAVSIAAPDRFHYDLARQAIDAGVDVLVEKPFVTDVDDGRELIARAKRAGVVLQVGHIERFNPVIETLRDVLVGEEIIAITADRLGPPVDRDVADDVVRDLMIHDLDLARVLVDGEVEAVSAARAGDDDHATATLSFDTGAVARLTASRITQQKVRELAVTTREARITVDYLAQSVEIHRKSVPAFVDDGGDLRYRHESIVERPTVERGEPLKNELYAFATCVRDGSTPRVTGADGLRALELVELVNGSVLRESAPPGVAR